MKGNNSNAITPNSGGINLSLISGEVLDTILTTQAKILEIVTNKQQTHLNGFISEKQAMDLLNKKATWFWQMRKSGRIKSSKIGQTNYYPIEDIQNLIK